MRTPHVLLAALLVALLAPTAAALGLPAARVEVRVDDARASAHTPERVEAPTLPGAAAALPPLPVALPPLAAAAAPLAGAAPFAPEAAPRAMGSDRAAAPPAPPVEVQAAAATGLLWLLLERLGLGRALAGGLAVLYSRLSPNELLDNERRERVLQLVRERPGIGPRDIGQATGMNWGVLSYHLDRLERAGLVSSQRVGQHRCYFLPGAVPRDAQEKVGVVRADTTRRVAQLVRERPGIPQRELAAALGLSASATSKQVSRLEAAALVRRETAGDGLRLYPCAALDVALPA